MIRVKTIAVIFMLVMGGCKKDTPANWAFVGRYYGVGNEVAPSITEHYSNTVRIYASGTNANQITLVDSPYGQSLTGTVNDNAIMIISGMAASNSGCTTNSITGQGSLNGHVLKYTLLGEYNCGDLEYDTISFNGTR